MKGMLALRYVPMTCSSGPTTANLAQAATKRGPTLTPQASGTAARLIGVHAVNQNVAWVSGVGGTFAVTTDGGTTWRSGVVPGAEALQFRDVEGVSATEAYLLSIGSGSDSRIYHTTDGGESWTLQFQNADPDAFYDCFAFWTPNRGFAYSDGVDGRFPVIRTTDGETWEDIGDNLPAAQLGEFAFASSGTCTAAQGGKRGWIGTGGLGDARILATTDGGDTWTAFPTPIVQGAPEGASGIFTVDFRDPHRGILAGGEWVVPGRGLALIVVPSGRVVGCLGFAPTDIGHYAARLRPSRARRIMPRARHVHGRTRP